MNREIALILLAYCWSIILCIAAAEIFHFSPYWAIGLDCLVWIAFCLGVTFQRWKADE